MSDRLDMSVAFSAFIAATSLKARAIVAICLTFGYGSYISKLRPVCPVIAVVLSQRLARLFSLCYGVDAICVTQPTVHNTDQFIVEIEKVLKEKTFLRQNDLYVLVCGASPIPGLANCMQTIRLGASSRLIQHNRQWTDNVDDIISALTE